MNRRRARHYVKSPDRWAEQSRGRVLAEAICARLTRAMLPFPRGESWGVNKLAPGSEGKPSWWSSLPETFTIHSTYLPETRPSTDKSGERATRRARTRCDTAAVCIYKFAVVHGFSLVLIMPLCATVFACFNSFLISIETVSLVIFFKNYINVLIN